MDIDLGNDMYWTASVKITKLDGTHISTVSLAEKKYHCAKHIDGHSYNTVEFRGTWTVPPTEGVVYKFTWLVNIYETRDKLLDTAQTVTYAKTPLAEPDGYFEVNGAKAGETTKLVVWDPSLSLKFVPTKNPEKITAVKVEVWKGSNLLKTVALSKTDGQYAGTYTLPSPGTYTLKGKIEWTDGNPLLKMSIMAQWGEEGGGDGEGGEGDRILKLLSAISIATGTVFIALGVMGRRVKI